MVPVSQQTHALAAIILPDMIVVCRHVLVHIFVIVVYLLFIGKTAVDPMVCSGNGQCLTSDTCVCYSGYNGTDCGNFVTGLLYASGDDMFDTLADNNVGLDFYNVQNHPAGYALSQFIPVISSQFTGMKIRSVSANAFYSLILTNNGVLYSIGYNGQGQLGTGDYNNRYTPYAISFTGNPTIAGMSAGYQHALAVDSTGKAWSWGYNGYGTILNNIVLY